jgi:centrosomal protein CEP76
MISLKLLGGKGFVGALTDEMGGYAPSYLVLHVHFRNQRFTSKPFRYVLDPQIDEHFLLDIYQNTKTPPLSDLGALLEMDFPVHFILVKHMITDLPHSSDPHTIQGVIQHSYGELFASHKMEWRRCLSKGGITLSLELQGVGEEAKVKVPAGVLEVRLDLLPDVSLGSTIAQTEISRQIRHEISQEADAQRHFYVYARAWWE